MEKDRINDTEKSFLSGKKRMHKLKVLMKYAGISVFEYFPDSDRMVLYNEQLEEEKGIMPFLGQLGQICTIHPEDVQKMREFLLGQTLGTVELKLLKKGHYKRVLLDALQKEEGDQSVIGCIRDITEIRKREELLEDQARRDSMTGLYNHDTGKLLVNEYLREKRMDASSGLLMLDVDHFKNVNDVYGHLFGDEVLIGFSGFLQSFFRKEDILIRTGGDEFVVFLKEISREALEKKVSELVKRVGKLTFSKRDFVMSCSVGVCFLPGGLGDYSYEQLLEHADLALYRAKIAGRNQYAVGEKLIPIDTGNKGETAVKLLMDETMEKREFEIYFQPKISLHNYKIVGAEALVRWRRPDGIVVRPEHFLPFYEKNGKIVELDFYVFEQVAAFLEKTKRSGITPVPVSVNVSALHAEDPQTTRRYLEILEKYKVDPGMLEMELKETDTIRYENIKDLLRSLQEAGFHAMRWSMEQRLHKKRSPEQISRLYYNAGLYYEMEGEIAKALEMYKVYDDTDSIFRLLVANARENAAIGNYYELRNYYLELPEDLIRGNPVLMMGMSLLQSILMNVDESERWYHELEEYQKRAEGSDAREAKGRLITLDISLPHRGISGMTDLLRAAGVLITDRKVHIPELSVTSNLPSMMNGGKDF